MKVVIPHARYNLHKLVAVSIQNECSNPVLYHCDKEDSYYELINELWHEGETFTIIEHDIIPWPGAVSELNECSRVWCLCPYNLNTNSSLGFTKFGEVLLKEHPNILENPSGYDKSWTRLDWYLTRELFKLGYQPHTHQPNVAHLHAHESWRRGII